MKKPARREGVLICGAYGLNNAGDEAILEAMIKELREIDPKIEICVLSRSPGKTVSEHGIASIHSFDFFSFLKKIKKIRLYISGGGSLIQNVTSRRSLWYYLLTIALAKRCGSRVMMYGCGIGPVTGRADEKRVRNILNKNVDCITLRDKQSEKELCRLGVTVPEIILGADPALILDPAPDEEIDERFRESGIPVDGKYIGFALRKWPGFEDKAPLIARAADYAYEKYGLETVFVPIDFGKDSYAETWVSRIMRAPYHSVEKLNTYGSVIGALSRMSALVSMRLHGLVFAAGQGVPLIGVVYDPKVRAFLEYMEQELFVDLSDLAPGILENFIDKAVAMPKEELAARHNVLQEKQKENSKAARRLLEDG